MRGKVIYKFSCSYKPYKPQEITEYQTGAPKNIVNGK